MIVELPNEPATVALAARLASQLPDDVSGWTILLDGELGAGKSTLARALLRAMGHDGPVPSPTYTLVEPYQLRGNTIYHVDLYRVVSEEELRYLGWSELDDGCRLVEWPDRAPGLLGRADVHILLEYRDSGRRATLTGRSARGTALVTSMS